ncbi:MAG: hypothetical protein WC467_04530 [Patescibacteria group bacterium]
MLWGLELVGSEMRVESEDETSYRASDNPPGAGWTPTLDERSRRASGGGKRESPLWSTI